jgi:rhamnose transport system ATP-binding protein
MRNDEVALLRLAGLAKSYAGVRALRGVSFDLRAGEVHAVVGENGAGKSTLIKAITGAVTADAGEIFLDGRRVSWMDPQAAAAAGIAAIYQQPALFPPLTVSENIALRTEHGRGWRGIDWKERRRRSVELLHRLGARIDPNRLVESLSMPEQQIVEIACVLGVDARIVIMDEPTASLGEAEVASLFRAVAALKERGAGIIYISHRLDEIFALADRVTVLRDGESVATRPAAGLTRAELVRLMVGRTMADVYPRRDAPASDAPVVLELTAIGHAASGVRDVSLAVRAGEIVGLAGLVGSGRTEVAEIVFGLRPADTGQIRIRGAHVRIGSPSDAIRLGIGYVPEDRRRHGVVLEMSVAANASLASLNAVTQNGLIARAREAAAAAEFVDRLGIKTPSVWADVGTLSGGNQQKVALARWLATRPAVLLLDEPTQGVDVGAKAEIHQLIAELARGGLAILLISSELSEVLGMCDRIAVMHGGTVAATVDRAQATQDRILHLALGHLAEARDR